MVEGTEGPGEGQFAYPLAGRRVLVTGASSGIGAGLAQAFAEAGAVVGICARRADRLAETLERCRAHAPESQMWVVDLADFDAVDRLAADATAAFGGVDVLVNNAGIPKRRHVTRLDAATVEAVMAVNFLSPARLTLALLPGMVERGQGRIVNVASVAAVLSPPGESAYSASKAALAVFSESLAVDLWETGVRTMTVYPGVVDTELFTLPDNDPFEADVDAVPVSEATGAVIDALTRGALQVYVPAWFGDLASSKAAKLEEFLAGTAEYVRSRRRPG
jgi:NAD(P)-dependent dehydrogenase (short-subunit alcohol dehydrogenase family)